MAPAPAALAVVVLKALGACKRPDAPGADAPAAVAAAAAAPSSSSSPSP
jgi:hypothetical protein